MPEPWVVYRFGESVTIDRMVMNWYNDGGGVRLLDGVTAYYEDDGGEWVEIVPALLNTKGSVTTMDLDPITTRSLKLIMHNAKSGRAVGILEWEVYRAD